LSPYLRNTIASDGEEDTCARASIRGRYRHGTIIAIPVSSGTDFSREKRQELVTPVGRHDVSRFTADLSGRAVSDLRGRRIATRASFGRATGDDKYCGVNAC